MLGDLYIRGRMISYLMGATCAYIVIRVVDNKADMLKAIKHISNDVTNTVDFFKEKINKISRI